MLSLPESPTDELKLADWLEIAALLAPDLNSHVNDLQAALIQASTFEAEGDESLEAKLLDTFRELEQRRTACGESYPFNLDGGLVQAREDWAQFSSYVFSLCLSYVDWERRPTPQGVFPARIFEALCAEAARRLVGGNSVRFGSPREPSEISRGFSAAVDDLCNRFLREGAGFRSSDFVHWTKDGGLDVVAWKEWPDERSAKLVLFGACATGAHWDEKLRDLDPALFWSHWVCEPPLSPLIRAFFVPHRVPTSMWEYTAREAGIIVDRCRIALLVPDLPASANNHGDGRLWIDAALGALRT